MTTERVKRLRDLVDLIERLPGSPDRDRMLGEVRSRVVDLDTGVTPRAMLPLREPAPASIPRRPAKPGRATTTALTAPATPAGPVLPPSRSTGLEEPLWVDDQLSLEDSPQHAPLPHIRARGDRAIAPWTLGPRG